MPRSSRDRRWASALLLVLVGLLAGCEAPCQALARSICECEPNRSLQLSCRQQVDAAKDRVVTEEEQEICERLLEGCTCEALDRDDFAACGLQKPIP